jgi:tetratricopeptide (TPR) repeat protein
MRKQNKGKFHFWSYIGTLGFGRHFMKKNAFVITILLAFFTVACGERPSVVRPSPLPDYPDDITEVPSDEPMLISSREAERRFSLALDYIYTGFEDRAVNELKYLISKRVRDKYIYLTLLTLYTNQVEGTGVNSRRERNILNEAKKYGKEAVALYPEFMPILYIHTEVSRLSSDFDEFLSTLDKILYVDNRDSYANYYKGAFLFLNDEYDAAIPYLETVIAFSAPSKQTEFVALYNAYKYMATINTFRKDYYTAIEYAERAKAIYDADFELLNHLAILYAEVLEFESAVENFDIIPEFYYTKEMVDIYAGSMFIAETENLSDFITSYFTQSTFIKALAYYNDKNYTNALSEVWKSIGETKSANYFQHYLLFLLYEKIDRQDLLIQQAFLLGRKARDVEKFNKAIEFFKIVEKNPDTYPDALWVLGSLYDDNADYTNAILYYNKYLDYADELEYKISAYVRLSFMYFKIGEKSLSIREIENARKLAQTDAEKYQVYYYSALLNLEHGNINAAIDNFKKCVEIVPNNPELYYFLSSTLARVKRNIEAIEYLKSARTFNPNSPEINNLLAYLYALEQTNLDEALKLVNLALVKDPENIAYLDTLGWVYFKMEKINKAFEVFQKIEFALENSGIDFGLDEVYYHLGRVYDALDQPLKAREYYQKGITANPDNKDIKTRLDE